MISKAKILGIFLFCFIYVQANDPTYCRAYTNEPYNCNCHDCNCQTCHTCGCEVKTDPWNSCTHDRCGDCWCSPIGCKCCYKSSCRYSCNCQQCCDTCYRSVCSDLITYRVNSIQPTSSQITGNITVTVTGGTFANTNQLLCRFGPTEVPAILLSNTTLRCVAPPANVPGYIPVEVSLDGGQHWTTNGNLFYYYQCPMGGPATATCSNHGVCNTDSTCACVSGYFGPACDSECPGTAANPCNQRGVNNVTCNADGTCTCSTGYYGISCENICPGGGPEIPCSGHGLCLSDGTCSCFPGFVGVLCSHNGTCDPDGTHCQCPSGFFGTGCDQECPGGSEHPCSDHGLCTSTGACVCLSGWYGELCEGECPNGAANPCSLHTATGTCGADGTCTCTTGWYGAACEIECPGGATNSCSLHGVCSTQGVCTCQAGWLGEACEMECMGGAANPCSGHGICDPTMNGTCTCADGYWGTDCSGECPGGHAGPCNNHGICDSVGQCTCLHGYYGIECAQECPGGAANPCTRHGACDLSGQCHCQPGYWGIACENECPGGAATPCSGFGICNETGVCNCNPGYGGTTCQERFCPYDCYSHGNCTDGACTCSDGWSGIYCSTSNAPNISETHGIIEFVQPSYTVEESAAQLDIIIRRGGGAVGQVNVIIKTQDGTAVAGADFIGVYGSELSWDDGETDDKAIQLIIILDGLPEAAETFTVVLDRVSGGAVLGSLRETLVTILSNEGLPTDGVAVQIKVLLTTPIATLPAESSERQNYILQFSKDISQCLNVSVARISVQYLQDHNGETLACFNILSSAQPQDPTPSSLASKLLVLIGNPNSTIYQGQVTQYIDPNYMPQVTTVGETPTQGGSDKLGKVLSIVLAVLGGVLALTLVCCYFQRHKLKDWFAWHIFSNHFTRFMGTQEENTPGDVPMEETSSQPPHISDEGDPQEASEAVENRD